MDGRLDPGCEEARTLHRKHRDQEALLVAGSEGQLAAVIRATQEKQLTGHLVRCARCRHYDPRCAACGFDPRKERHGWMCPNQPARWRDVFPWNWRAKQAPRPPPGAAWRHRAEPGASRSDPAEPGPARPPAAPPGPTRPPEPVRRVAVRSEYSPPVAERPASSAPKPRPRPAAPKPSALALAYASLGLSPDANEDAVRAAYRQRAQQYHPDKVSHMAPEFREVAEQKMSEINLAYEKIKRSWPAAAK